MKKQEANSIISTVLIIGLIITVILIYATKGKDPHQCEQYYFIYDKEIKGEILNLYSCPDNIRVAGCIDIIQKDKKYTFKRFTEIEKVYSSLQRGDSIIKLVNSYSFKFYRGNEYIGNIEYPCSDPSDPNK